jgi:voltage-gated potassium channel
MQAGQSVPESDQFTLGNSFWYSIYTLFAGEPTPIIPQTISGRIVTVFIMFMGLTLFAIFAGTVSAYMVDRFRAEGKVVNWDEIFDHVVVCGWTSKTEIIIREYRADREFQMTPVVVVAQIDLDTSVIPTDIRDNVIFLNDDFTRVSALERAGIHRAKTCIILADTSGGRSEQDADARTILAALTVEKIAPQVQTSAELLHRTYGTHLDLGQVNSYVVSGEYGAYMLAQEAMNRGSMGVIDELLTCQRGNEFYRYPVLEKWVGMTFTDLMNELKTEHNAILVGVHPAGKKVIVNPVSHVFAASDQIVAISEEQIEF